MELAAFFVAQELVAEFGAEHEMHDDVGEGLGHNGGALTGLTGLGGRLPGPSGRALT